MQLISVLPQTINICYSPPGRSILGKTVPEVLILKTEGTVCPNMDWPRMVNDILINKSSVFRLSHWQCSHVRCRLQCFEAMRSTGHAWSYKAWCSAVIVCQQLWLVHFDPCCSAISEHAYNYTGYKPLWNEVKFIDHDPYYYTNRVKEAIHIRLHPNNIKRDSGIEIPEAWMPMIKRHNNGRAMWQ